MTKLTYKSSGVNYDLLDNLKRMAQEAASNTEKNILNTGFSFSPSSRGESAIVIKQTKGGPDLIFVQEGLGTKNLVADAFGSQERTYYDAIAQDTVAMIVNDLITVGARPVGISAYWAIGSEEWFTNEKRMKDLVKGWENACTMSLAVWVGGETPTLSGIVNPQTIDLAGSAFGIIDNPNKQIDGESLQAGDAIVIFESSGIHANGVSLARKLAESLPDGYKTKLSSGRMYGEALLDPTIIYATLVQDLFTEGVGIHYMANITGHGWRKLLRNKKEFTYKITSVPPVPEVLQFIQKEAELTDEEAYGNFNMGAGFAIFVLQEDVQKIIDVATRNTIKAYRVGTVEEGQKQVIIQPKNITFSSESLQVRI